MKTQLTISNVCQRCGVSREVVTKWINSGELVAVNVASNKNGNRRWRIQEEDLESFLKSRSTARPARQQRRRQRYQPLEINEFTPQ
jgi:excisionase family DNA binding protein